MLFNTPLAVGFGNGLGVPAAFIFATVILTIFSVGYVAMSRKVTTAGGFYSYISHGLGRNYVGCLVSLPTTSAFSGTFGSGVGLFIESVQPDRSKFVVINAIQPCVADLFVY